LPILGRAEEQVERLRENQRMLMTVDENRFQRGEDVGAVADFDHLQCIQRVDDSAGPYRNASGAERTGKADDVIGDQAGSGRDMIYSHRTTWLRPFADAVPAGVKGGETSLQQHPLRN